jgi:hypothetical protein
VDDLEEHEGGVEQGESGKEEPVGKFVVVEDDDPA